MKKIALTFILFLGIIFTAQAQSLFLEKDQDGLGINGGFSTNKDVSGVRGGVGYSFSGVFDLGISVGRVGFGQKFFGEKLRATTISPFASYLVVKQEEQIPVSFALDFSYQREIYSNRVLSDNNIDMTANAVTFGASLYSMFEASEAMKIQPFIGFNFFTGKIKFKDSFGSDTDSFNSTQFLLGLSLVFQTSPPNTFVVTPALGFGEDVTTFGLGLSLVLPQN